MKLTKEEVVTIEVLRLKGETNQAQAAAGKPTRL